jgi:hypothetical protein
MDARREPTCPGPHDTRTWRNSLGAQVPGPRGHIQVTAC